MNSDLERLARELKRRLEVSDRLWNVFKDIDFVRSWHTAADLAKLASAELGVPLSYKLRRDIRNVLQEHDIVPCRESHWVRFRHKDWRRICDAEKAIEREQYKLSRMSELERLYYEAKKRHKELVSSGSVTLF